MTTLGINTWVWTSPLSTEAFRPLAARIARMGFDLVEVPLEQLDDFDARTVGAMARDAGLGVSVAGVIGPDRDLLDPDSAVRANGMAYLRGAIEATHTLGATNLIGPFYSAVGRTWLSTADERQRDLDLLEGELRDLSRTAGDHGVVLCLEPLNRFETSFINLAAQAIEVVDRVDHANLGIMLDTFHMNIEERSLGDAIRAVGPRLRHLHACENDRGAPGSGHVPWTDVATACGQIGFKGPFVIESFTHTVTSIARAAAVWRPFATSQDELAESGLRHLRSLMG